MAGGPVWPHSSHPDVNGRVFPGPHIGATNSAIDFGMQVEASLGADSIWHLRFQVPEILPSGTGKLRLLALAANSTQVARVNPKWVSAALTQNPDTLTRNAEGVQSITWTASDAYLETKITLDADTIVAGEIIVMDMTFETASWTLSDVSTWWASIIWE